ncbi:hypothetical protein [Chitinimonas naiadis]
MKFITAAIALLTASMAHATDCPSLDLQPLLQRQPDFLLLGELHGTEQAPAFAGDLACKLLEQSRPLILGLELPPTEQNRLDAYLRSDGSAAARATLLAGPHWDSAKWSDGRNSQAMLQLIERVRGWRSQGKAITLLAFADGGDAGYAQSLAKSRQRPEQLVLALVGNIHANRAELNKLTGARPMGSLLGDAGHTLSLNISYPGGEAWVCQSPEPDSCGILGVQGSPKAIAAGQITLVEARRDNTLLYDGWFDVGTLSASLPANPLPPLKPTSRAQ